MTIGTFHWEKNLLKLALEALEDHKIEEHHPNEDRVLVKQAYQYCAQLTKVHSKTFYMATRLLPVEKRHAARALYAFCRISDDLVDKTDGNAYNRLETWRKQSIRFEPPGDDIILLAWNDTRKKYQIPRRYADQLLNGVAKDLHQNRYQTFEELTTYCYGVACTVGLMAMHIIGFSDTEAISYAIRLGVALQMTNILRDIGEDWKMGRVYLPQEELKEFGLSDLDISEGKVTENWRFFMQYQIERNRKLYNEALPGIRFLNRDGRFAIQAAAELYQAILVDIENNDYNVFNRRASVSKWGKLQKLPGVWWRSLSSGVDVLESIE